MTKCCMDYISMGEFPIRPAEEMVNGPASTITHRREQITHTMKILRATRLRIGYRCLQHKRPTEKTGAAHHLRPLPPKVQC